MKNLYTKLIFIFLIPLLTGMLLQSCSRQRIVSIKSLLMEMTDKESITRIPSPWYNLIQYSSYDRETDTVGGKGWFANADYTQFIGIDSSSGRKEYILLDTDGPGAIVRWWMTFSGGGGYDGIIRIYIDNDISPVIEDNVLKVVSGHLLAGDPLSSSVSSESNLFQRGHNLYMPIPFSKHCRITIQSDAIKITANSRKPSIYYNICCRKYEKGTRVVSFSENELKNGLALIKKTNEILISPDNINFKNKKIFNAAGSVPSNDSLSIEINRKNSAIRKITVNLSADNTEFALRSTVLEIRFDGLQTVWVPVGDFFGTGYKKTKSSTWNSKVDDQMNMETYWLMPFQNNCFLSIINYGKQTVKAKINVETSKYNWEKNNMYFGSSWHEYNKILAEGAESTGGTGHHRDINFIEITGMGIYAGDAVTVFNTVDAWWGEGDEKIFVDGEAFPSSIGTGTEDYFGYAWCRPELFTHPFIAQPSGSGNFNPGLTINMRYRSLDAIPFKSSISSNIELWHWVRSFINYGLTTYWYILPPYEINIKPDPEAVKLALPAEQDIHHQ